MEENMKQRLKILSLLTFTLVIFSFLLLGGCVSTKQKFQDDMMAQGVKPLSSSEIKELLSDATQYNKVPKREWKGYYSADGKIQARAWGSWGEQSDEGEWRVKDGGILCDRFLGKWSKFGEGCYSVYPGKAKDEYTLIKVSGAHTKNYPDGVIPVKITPGM